MIDKWIILCDCYHQGTSKKIAQVHFKAPGPISQGKRVALPLQEPMRLSPFKEAVADHCNKEEKARLPAELSPLEKIGFSPEDELAKRFTDELKVAHQNNTDQTFTFYSPKENIQDSSRALQKIAGFKSRELLGKARKILDEIEMLANYPTEEQFALLSPKMQEEVVNYRLKQHGLQSIKLTFRDPLFQSLLMRNGDVIKERNPFLKDEDIIVLHEKMLQYIDLMNQKTQADAARPLLIASRKKKDDTIYSKAAALLDHDRRYDLHQYPELAVYEYATGFQLRPEQVKILTLIIELTLSGREPERLKQLCFEFQAGGGKTKVISAILAARIHVEGKVPIFFSVPHLEEVTQVDLKEALYEVFERRLSRIHYKIKDKIELPEVEEVIATFEKALAEKRTLFMTPETWHTLNLARIHAIKGRQAELDIPPEKEMSSYYKPKEWHERYLRDVEEIKAREQQIRNHSMELEKAFDHLFDLMKEKGVALIDEGHLNADALHETNRAAGKPLHIPRRERRIFATMARYLICDPILQKLVKLAQNKQTTMLAKHLPRVKKRLASLMCKEFRNDIPKENVESLKSYWLNPNADGAEWIIKLQKSSKKNLHDALLLKRIDLVRGLINTVLPFTLNRSNELDYQLLKDAKTEVLIPAKQGFPSNSHFQNPDVAALVSCQGTFQNGLTERQLKNTIEQYVKSYEADLRRGVKDKDSKPAFQWLKIQEECEIKPDERFTLADYIDAKEEQKEILLKSCHEQMSRHIGLIEQYLMDEILPKISIYPEVEQSTATNLVEAFNTSILFSATMGIQEKYPVQEDPKESHLRDLEFMDQVMTRATLPQNSTMHWKEESTPSNLLRDLSPVEFIETEGIINVGSFCEKASSEEWADAFLSLAKERGLDKQAALFFKTDANGKISLCLKMAKEPAGIRTISGSNLAAVFASLGLRTDQVYKIFAPSETTGTDFPISANARMLLSIGDHVNLSFAVQSIMRMRGFLNDPIDPVSSQKISWVGAVDYHNKIKECFPNDEVTPQHFFAYALEKEIENDRAAIKQQAVQEIEAIIVGEVEEKRRNGQEISKHKKAYERKLGRDPSALYGGANTQIPTKDYLIGHAKAFAANVNLSLDKLTKPNQEKINTIAERAANLVRMTEQRKGSNLAATMEQHIQVEQRQEQKREQRQELRNKNNVVNGEQIATMPENKHKDSLFAGPISKTFGAILCSPGKLVNSIFPEDLFFFQKHHQTHPTQIGVPSRIKQADLFLVEEIDGVKQAFVLSGYDADKFIDEINNTSSVKNGKNGEKICIFTASGRLVRNGPQGANFTADELHALEESEWMKDKVCQIGFWNGKIVDKNWTVKKLNPSDPLMRENFVKAWAWICQGHLNQAHPQISIMDELIAETNQSIPVIDSAESRADDISDAIEYPELEK